jgi:hypothetical protein
MEFDPGYFVSRFLPDQACRAHVGRPSSALIFAIDCLLVISAENATTPPPDCIFASLATPATACG